VLPSRARWFLAVVLAVTAAGNTAAQTAKSPAPNPGDRAKLLQLEETWAKALVKRDDAAFRRLLAQGFVYTEDDRLMNRAEVLREIVSGSDTVTAAHNEGMVVHLFGATGVVTGLLHVEGRSKGAAFVRRYRFTDTWVRQPAGAWQIVAAQDYLIPTKR
jgi:ketosteroid isomerase-like protein